MGLLLFGSEFLYWKIGIIIDIKDIFIVYDEYFWVFYWFYCDGFNDRIDVVLRDVKDLICCLFVF